jgi:hypothetical protein
MVKVLVARLGGERTNIRASAAAARRKIANIGE